MTPSMFKFIQLIEHELTGAILETSDAVCYGSIHSASKAGEGERSVRRIWDGIPKKIKNDYLATKRTIEANRLRQQADKIERGVA